MKRRYIIVNRNCCYKKPKKLDMKKFFAEFCSRIWIIKQAGLFY